MVRSHCLQKSAGISWDHFHYSNKGTLTRGVKYWLSLKIFAKYRISWIKSLYNINIASDFCFIQILNIVAKILDISNIAWKNRYINYRIRKQQTSHIIDSRQGSSYKLLVLQMDNSIANVFDSAMLRVAPNCRIISHTFCRTKDTVLCTASDAYS